MASTCNVPTVAFLLYSSCCRAEALWCESPPPPQLLADAYQGEVQQLLPWICRFWNRDTALGAPKTISSVLPLAVLRALTGSISTQPCCG